MDVRIIERHRWMAYLGEHTRDRALRDEADRQRDGEIGKKRTNAKHGTEMTAVTVRGLYREAPRLPSGDRVDLRTLVSGDWIEIEVGPGRGWFLVERAQVEPLAGLVGMEIRRKWAAVVDARLTARSLSRHARVFAEDAREALPRLGPDASVRRIFVNFPDPWWKKRHAKRRLVESPFLDQIARLLEPAGELFVQTDVEERAQAYEQLIELDARFLPAGDAVGSARVKDSPYLARSPRERRAMADGLPVYRMRWRRR